MLMLMLMLIVKECIIIIARATQEAEQCLLYKSIHLETTIRMVVYLLLFC